MDTFDEQGIVKFFKLFTKPNDTEQVRERVINFINNHETSEIVLISSGGTIVPLEHNTVRFMDNFSAGTRGSASAEYFLDYNYAVIYLYRSKSLEPFTRHVNLMELLRSIVIGDKLEISDEMGKKLRPILEKLSTTKDKMLMIPFTTLSEYLYYLKEIAISLKPIGPQALLYLAAAVSDFYIPPSNMAMHKIQSASGPLSLNLEIVPKILRPLIKYWAPNAFVVSFKLETDESILLSKARNALVQYGHSCVIANTLQSRKTQVLLVTHSNDELIKTTDGCEIEEIIVKKMVEKHKEFKESHKNKE